MMSCTILLRYVYQQIFLNCKVSICSDSKWWNRSKFIWNWECRHESITKRKKSIMYIVYIKEIWNVQFIRFQLEGGRVLPIFAIIEQKRTVFNKNIIREFRVQKHVKGYWQQFSERKSYANMAFYAGLLHVIYLFRNWNTLFFFSHCCIFTYTVYM